MKACILMANDIYPSPRGNGYRIRNKIGRQHVTPPALPPSL